MEFDDHFHSEEIIGAKCKSENNRYVARSVVTFLSYTALCNGLYNLQYFSNTIFRLRTHFKKYEFHAICLFVFRIINILKFQRLMKYFWTFYELFRDQLYFVFTISQFLISILSHINFSLEFRVQKNIIHFWKNKRNFSTISFEIFELLDAWIFSSCHSEVNEI